MAEHGTRMVAFLAGELDVDAARAFDEHLLSCEACWRAVQEDRQGRAALDRIRVSLPPGLVDRVMLAVELADRREEDPDPASARRSPRRDLRWTGAGLLATVVAAAIAAVVAALSPVSPTDPAPVAAVVRAARLMPSPTPTHHRAGAPVPLGPPERRVVDGASLALTYYRLDGAQVVRAVSDRPFAEPAGAHPLGGTPGMAWVAMRGDLALYCYDAPRPTLVVGRVPADRLPRLARRLPP